MSHSLQPAWRLGIGLGALGVVACLSGTELVTPPRAPVTTLTLEFHADSEDLRTATALGWADRIPGVAVTVTPEDTSTGPALRFEGSPTGTLTLDQPASGRYLVDAVRWLTPAERAGLASGDDAMGFVARVSLSTPSAVAQMPVALVASRRKDLLISEWAFNIAAPPEVNTTYHFGGFIELYNNADTTAYLDGLLIARGVSIGFDYPNFPCSAYAVFADDPEGIWAREVQQFPGRGRDYPVQPGGIVVIAIDAIDHSKLFSSGLDLSHADFEFWGGPGDVDNPAAGNMSDTLALGANALGHGPVFQDFAAVAVLARPYSLATVPRKKGPTGAEYARISADLIIDVVTLFPNYVSEYGPRCPRSVHPQFDQRSFDGRGYDENVEYEHSVSRRSIPGLAAGHPVLQRSRNSDADFIRTLRSPGRLP